MTAFYFSSQLICTRLYNRDFARARSTIGLVRKFRHARIGFAYNQQTVKPRKFKFGLNIAIKESVMCANFENPRSRDRELRHKKTKKSVVFGLKSY